MIKAVIFDMDGTIVDTETLGMSTIKDFLNKHNMKYTEEKILELVYRDYTLVLKEIYDSNNREIVPEELGKLRQNYLAELDNVKLFPHVINLLESIHDKVIMILATNSDEEITRKIFEIHDLDKYFDVIIARDTYTKKGFLKKSDMLKRILSDTKLKPEECIYIDDSHYGVGAGKKCNIMTIGVQHMFKDLEADMTVDDLDKVKEIILKKLNIKT